jgi:hypothetical protein
MSEQLIRIRTASNLVSNKAKEADFDRLPSLNSRFKSRMHHCHRSMRRIARASPRRDTDSRGCRVAAKTMRRVGLILLRYVGESSSRQNSGKFDVKQGQGHTFKVDFDSLPSLTSPFESRIRDSSRPRSRFAARRLDMRADKLCCQKTRRSDLIRCSTSEKPTRIRTGLMVKKAKDAHTFGRSTAFRASIPVLNHGFVTTAKTRVVVPTRRLD